MRTDIELYDEILKQAYAAKSLRDEFDTLWLSHPNHTPYAAVLYTVRYTALLNCFSNPLNLFCSPTLWQFSLGPWAKINNVEGPLNYPESGDKVDKTITLFEAEKAKILAIFSLYRTESERDMLDEEVAHITTTVRGAQNSLKRWKDILNN
jgi:hypothetical protein